MTASPTTKQPASPRKRRSTASARAYAYFLAALGGLLPLFLWSEPPLGFLLVWPSAVMVVYAFLGLDEAKDAHLTFEFADSFYYLGFTLSVGSLLAALHPFSSEKDLPEGLQMLRYFGAGMMSTLVGVIGRTVMQLFFRSTGENVASINARIDEAASEFLDNLGNLNKRAIKVLDGGQKAVEHQLETINTHWQSYGPAAQTTVEALTALLTTAGAGAREFDAKLKEIGLQLERADAAMKKWNTQATEGWGAIDQVQNRVSSLLSALESDYSRVKDTANAVAGMTGSMKSVQSALAALQDSIENTKLPVSPLIDQLNAFNAAVSAIASRLQATADALDQTVTRYTSQVAQLVQHTASGEAIGQLRSFTAVGADVAALTAQFAPLKQALSDTISEVKQFNTVLDEIADAAISKLERIG